MLKDIPHLVVEEIAIAVVVEDNDAKEKEWNVYLINLKKERISNILVISKGYGILDGKEVKTSLLRHYFDYLESKCFLKVEPIIETLFGLNNEYWISFSLNGSMYDKKYIFLPESIIEENLVTVPLINKKGVMIK